MLSFLVGAQGFASTTTTTCTDAELASDPCCGFTGPLSITFGLAAGVQDDDGVIQPIYEKVCEVAGIECDHRVVPVHPTPPTP